MCGLTVTQIDRRTLLRTGLAATALSALGTAGCSTAASPAQPGKPVAGPHLIGPDSPQVAATEAARYKTGRVVPVALAANSTALALVSTGMGTAPDVLPRELSGHLASYDGLHAAATAALSARQPDVTYKLQLTGGTAEPRPGGHGGGFWP